MLDIRKLEIRSKPEVESAPYKASISRELKGMPKGMDVKKRKITFDLVSIYKDSKLAKVTKVTFDITLAKKRFQLRFSSGSIRLQIFRGRL